MGDRRAGNGMRTSSSLTAEEVNENGSAFDNASAFWFSNLQTCVALVLRAYVLRPTKIDRRLMQNQRGRN